MSIARTSSVSVLLSCSFSETDTIKQWREHWSSASVVNHTIVTDPTIRQPGFDLPRRAWSLVTVYRQVNAYVVLTCTNVVSPNHLTVIVASDRP